MLCGSEGEDPEEVKENEEKRRSGKSKNGKD
jgi:hypothetical protein